MQEDDDADDWFRAESDGDIFEDEDDADNAPGDLLEVPRTDNESAHRQKSLNRQNTPLPGDIERASTKSRDSVRVEAAFSEEEEEKEEKDELSRRMHSFQSSRKDTPFPEQIVKTLSSTSGRGSNGRSQTPLGGVNGFEEEEEEEEISTDLDRDNYPEQSKPASRESGGYVYGKNSFNGPDEVNDDRLITSQSAPSRNDSFAASNSSRPSTKERNTRLRPLTPEGTFRREYSKDHPLAGGKGKYSKEKSAGKKEIAPRDFGTAGKKKKYERVAEVVSRQEQKKMDLQRNLEALRKHQNDALLEVLEEERKAEEERNRMGRSVKDVSERNRCSGSVTALFSVATYVFEYFHTLRSLLYLTLLCRSLSRLELVFAEERKRASERIITMTKDHEKKMKDVILAMDLGS